jgi:hypothetical protein
MNWIKASEEKPIEGQRVICYGTAQFDKGLERKDYWVARFERQYRPATNSHTITNYDKLNNWLIPWNIGAGYVSTNYLYDVEFWMPFEELNEDMI